MPRSTGQLYLDLAKLLNELESRDEDPGINEVYGKTGDVKWDADDKKWYATHYGGKEE